MRWNYRPCWVTWLSFRQAKPSPTNEIGSRAVFIDLGNCPAIYLTICLFNFSLVSFQGNNNNTGSNPVGDTTYQGAAILLGR